MRLKRVAAAAAVLIVLVVAGLVIAVRNLEPRALALNVAASVKQQTGRELTFGQVGVNLFPRAAIELSDVRLGNAPWGSQPWMAAAAQAEADIDVWALLRGSLRVTRIAVSDASLLLETDPAGNGNWVFGQSGGGTPAWLSGLEINALELKSFAVTWHGGSGGETQRFLLDSVTVHEPVAAQPIRFELHGNIAGEATVVIGSVDGLAALVADGSGYAVNVHVQRGTGGFTLRGTVDQPRELGAVHLDLEAQGPEASDVAALLGEKLPLLGAFRAAAQLAGAPEALVVSKMAIDIGAPEQLAFSLRGGLEAPALRSGALDWKSADLQLSAEGAEIRDLAKLFGESAPLFGHFRGAARLTGSSTTPSLADIDVTFGSVERVQLTARGAVANVRAGSGIELQVTAEAKNWWDAGGTVAHLRLPPFRLRTRLRDAPRGYRADGLELNVANSRLSAALAVVTGGARPRINAELSASIVDLSQLGVPAADVARKPAQPDQRWELADVEVDLKVAKLVLADRRVVQAVAGRLSLSDGQLKATGLKATLGGARVQCQGVIADPAGVTGLNVDVSMQGNELAEFLQFVGHPIPLVGPFQGKARAIGSLRTLQLTAIEATAGKPGQRLRATGEIQDSLNWQGVDLKVTANIADSVAFGNLFGAQLPRLPKITASARMTGPAGGYAFEDLKFALPRTSMQGRLAIAPAEPRPRITASLSGPLLDLGELPAASDPAQAKLVLDSDLTGDFRFDRVVLVSNRVLAPVSGHVENTAGAAMLRQLTLGVDGATVTLDGGLAQPLRGAGLDLAVSADVKHVAGLKRFTGMALPDLPSFTMTGHLTDIPGGYALAKLKLASGRSELNGDVTVATVALRPKVTARLTSPRLDWGAHEPGPREDPTFAQTLAQARLFSDAPLPLDLLQAVDADVDLHVDQLRLHGGEPWGPVTFRALLVDGNLHADPVRLGIGGDQFLALTGSVDSAKGRPARWSFTLTGNSINLGDNIKRFGIDSEVRGGVTDFTLEGKGRGNSVRALLGSLNGSVRIKVGPAVVVRPVDNRAVGLLPSLLNLANPFRNTDPQTQITCIGINVPIKDGVVTSDREAAAETAKFNVVVSGTIDLRTEAIDLWAAPFLVRGFSLGSSNAQPVHATGTLADPQLDANIAGMATRGALSLGTAYMTFGGSWLLESLLSRATNDPNPCVTALRE